ncbi:MAG TPA: helix-turn-helix transcriptional regulator [Candidatus Angelobacter sp.]|jgi:ribosome-binding protein aMBF1 (putative translation factor)|nr:helix-turn-helix transcriptional regulator [Candidatus Angelobacter sp.]
MKSSWDAYLQRQMKKPGVKRAFQQESKVLNIGISLARERKKKGLTQEQVAKKIGTSIPQVSRTERRPDHSNVQTLMRYASAMGLQLDVRLTGKH